MDLSVLISVYNGENYVKDCLTGVLNQNLNPDRYEIILIDDGSTDSSYDLALEFSKKHSQIKVYSQSNMGLFNTRNKLLSLAKGKYIYNLDVDDALVENRLDQILNFGLSENLDLVGFKSRESDNITSKDLIRNEKEKYELFENGASFICSYPKHRVEVWWYIVKRSFLLEKELRFEDNQNNADVRFTYQVLLGSGKMAYFDWLCHYYYQSPDSIMRSNDFDKNFKLVNTMHAMVLSNSYLLDEYVGTNSGSKALPIIKQRINQFAYVNLVKMINFGLSFTFIKQKLKELKGVNIYPFNMESFSKRNKKVRILAFLINFNWVIWLGTMTFQFKRLHWTK
ncbi:glycosyltransferase family 2 protein [Flagellimonas sp.]|uniref:glycosyltransferase family 2 protein n=1 Tax=Flagellimonas sp. TaxID=2058762 RepID=UPI003F49CB82